MLSVKARRSPIRYSSGGHIRHSYHDNSFPPIDERQLRQLDDAAERLLAKLKSLNVPELPLPPFLRNDAVELLKSAEETITKYVHVLAWSLYPELPRKYSAFVDYGGGYGILSCLIKEADLADVVIYNDILDACCSGARQLARYLDCEADDYVCGNIAVVKASLDGRRLASCAVASINVIEHIYDVDDFVRTAADLHKGPMTMVLSTSANPFNPLVRRRHSRQHNEIIQVCAQHLSVADVEMLTCRTRGMRKDDIEKAVRLFEVAHQLPPVPSHPTNTCDPITGSWQERLLDVPAVTRTFEESGFSVTVVPGYYGSGIALSNRARRGKKVAASMLNCAIAYLGPRGVRIAPCLILHGARR